jgi:hypothetical protein
MTRNSSCGVLTLILLAGCPAGRGEGWVAGSLYVENCRDGELLAKPPGEFDLEVDFFAGDPLIDRDKAVGQRRSTLAIRLQATSNRQEQSDGLSVQVEDLSAAAVRFARGEPMPLQGSIVDPVRAQLHLFNSCPANRSPLVALDRSLTRPPTDDLKQCLTPLTVPSACPTLTTESRAALDQLCKGEFSLRTPAVFDQITQLLGGGACIYFCTLGQAARGQLEEELETFELDFGDSIAAIFSFNLIDGRSVELGSCADASGQINGMFRFDLVRSRIAQAFP